MRKNILIVGPPRCGKTTLARTICQKQGYNLISLDDIVCGLEGIPECEIRHDLPSETIAKRFAGFLPIYLKQLSEGTSFYGGISYVVEGTHIDLDIIMPLLKDKKLGSKYEIIGLLYDGITSDTLFDNIRAHDTEDDWTYWCDDDSLKALCREFTDTDKVLENQFRKWEIQTYRIGKERTEDLESICETISESCSPKVTKT